MTTQDMDGPIRTAYEQTIKVLKEKGFESTAGILNYYNADKDELAAAAKKKLTPNGR